MKCNAQKVWGVTWKTLVGVVLLFVALVFCSECCDRYVRWHDNHVRHQRYGVYTHFMPDETAFRVKIDLDHYYRIYDAETGKALTPKLGYVYTGRVYDTLTVYRDLNNRRGYLNAKTGCIALPAQWDHAWVFSEGVGAVVKNGRLGFIDHQGKWALEPRFVYEYTDVEFVFKNGLCTVKDSCGLLGIIDHDGNYVLQPEYSYISRIGNGLRELRQDGKRGLFCDSTRQVLLPCEYDQISLSDEGITLAKDGRKWMVAHDLKTVVYPFLFDRQSTFTVYLDEEDSYGNRKHYEYQPIGYYTIDYRYGLLDRRTGQPITPAIYSDINYVSPNLFECQLPGYAEEHIFVDAKGNLVE